MGRDNPGAEPRHAGAARRVGKGRVPVRDAPLGQMQGRGGVYVCVRVKYGRLAQPDLPDILESTNGTEGVCETGMLDKRVLVSGSGQGCRVSTLTPDAT